MHVFSRLCLLFALVVCSSMGCWGSSDRAVKVGDRSKNGIVTVYAVNYPLRYFAERIGGQNVRVVLPVPLGEDPALWQPDAETISACQQADLILLNGASYARWTKTVSLPMSKIVDTSAPFADRYIVVKDVALHAHGLTGEHMHAGTACTTWLDFQLALTQAESISQAFQRLQPRLKDDFRRNFAELESDLNTLDLELRDVVRGKTDRPIIFSHPRYQYLQRCYNLTAETVHWEPDDEPSEAKRQELEGILARHPVTWIVWDRSPTEENVKWLEEFCVKSSQYDPCDNQPEVGDFLSVMEQNVDNLARVFRE